MNNHFDISPLSKVNNCANLSKIAKQIGFAVEEFKLKAPHRTDFIKASEIGRQELIECELFICELYREMEMWRGQAQLDRISNYKFIAEINELKEKLELSEKKYIDLLNFNK